MTDLADSAERAKRRSGYASAPGRFADARRSADRARWRGADRAHRGAGHSAGAAAGSSIWASPDPIWCATSSCCGRSDSTDCRRRHGGRPARGIRRDHAGAVSQSPRRSRAGRRLVRRRARGGGSIVFVDSQIGESLRFMQNQVLPFTAFVGSLATTVILYRISSRSGRTSIAIFLLAGIAIAAIANAGIGLLVFIADDRQLRDITFWLLGSLSGATKQARRWRRCWGSPWSPACRSRAGSTCWCSAKPRRFTAASMSS